ncbi:MAG TPA: SIS domain-containing protein [Baekduia sp.]|uniref:SIS domain-containing protein n=1 Tax=Baekduia sp. TaxID=2600305 RepID=UPI002D79412C|nr:SIS domain-containing protein [Baekduia sp.]HET6510466.1 SIS domain-containing protein [Baekduia sp.]
MSAPGQLMAAEMAEQPRVLAELAARRAALGAEVRAALGAAAPVGIVLVARGSSDNAAVFGRYVLELATRRPVALAAPSLVTRYGVRDRLDGWLAVGVSQSGKTPEIVTVLERYGAAGATTVAITNDRDSPLAGAASATIDTAAGAERAVPATKTVTSQFAAFAVLAEALAPDASALPWDDAAWAALPDAVGGLLADDGPAKRAAAAIGPETTGLVAIARGLLLGAALESALKVKETTGILAEGASAADFLHGPIAVVNRALPVLTLSAGGPAAADVAEFADAARARGGRVLAIGADPGADLPIPAALGDGLSSITAIVRAQQLARAVSLQRGIDPDTPFGLSKVTATR